MDINWIFVLVLIIIFCSTFVRTAFGFGDALMAMPLLAMLLGIRTAAPLLAFISPIISVVIIVSNRQKAEFRGLWKLIIPTLLGIPIGLYYLQNVNENVVKLILGIIIILFCMFNIFRPSILKLKNDRHSWAFGLVSGLLGGAYNANGPPIIVYGALRRWKPANFRTLLQGVFLPTNICILIGHGLSGLWTPVVLRYFWLSLPVTLASIIIGNKVGNAIPADKFTKYVYLILMGLGVLLLVNSVRS